MIRKINRNDRNIYLELTKRFYETDAVLEPIPEKHRIDTFEELMRSDEYAQCYILESENNVAGYALLSKTFSQEAGGIVVWLEEFYVTDEYRGRGLGKEFLSYMEKNIPAARFRLEVEKDNFKAISLYKRAGFSYLPYIQLKKDL
jgi:ribosomal protein S18 acetylase RimI-like enzyme